MSALLTCSEGIACGDAQAPQPDGVNPGQYTGPARPAIWADLPEPLPLPPVVGHPLRC